jgi:hypothetical protein
VQEFSEFGEAKERGEFFVFKGLQKASIGAASRKLKMRRLPPTIYLHKTPRMSSKHSLVFKSDNLSAD